MINKEIQLDSAFIDANIITMDQNIIVQGGIGCYNGEIVALNSSENILDMCSHNTEIHRLEGKFVTPGFVDSHRLLYEELFSPYFFKIEEIWDLGSIAQEIDYFIIENFNPDLVFGYGFSEKILEGKDLHEIAKDLDEVSDGAKVILLSSSEKKLIYNSAGKELLESKGIGCENLSDDDLYKLVVLLDLDYQDLKDQLKSISLSACECGITSIQNAMCPRIFKLAIQEILDDPSEFKTRILDEDALLVTDFRLQRVCEMERGQALKFFEGLKRVKLVLKDEESLGFVPEFLKRLEEGGCAKQVLIYSDLANHEFVGKEYNFEIVKTWGFFKESSRVIEHSGNGFQATEYLTKEAANLVGRGLDLGIIKAGATADFAVFEENPLQLTAADFNKLLSEITVIAGKVVYNKEEEKLSQEFDMMLGQLI